MTQSKVEPAQARALVVGLNEALVKTDTAWEALINLLARAPWQAVQVLMWIVRGRAYFKQKLALASALDVARLPYRAEVLDYIADARAQGRPVYLATAADQKLANDIADYLGVFDAVLASDGVTLCQGTEKLEMIREVAGGDAFDYVGCNAKAMPVWRACQRAVLVRNSALAHRLKQDNVEIVDRLALVPGSVGTWLRAIRIHQWPKNALLFLPMLLGHHFDQIEHWLILAGAFIAFSLTASATYLINDLMDLADDRGHATKSKRPLASGMISLFNGVFAAAAMLTLSFLGAAVLLPPVFLLLMLGYLIATLSYSLYLKRQPILDVLLLGGLYTYRVIVGGIIIATPLSFWLLAFAMFFFLGLACVKRYADLERMLPDDNGTLAGRGYRASDLVLVQIFGVLASYMSVLIMALYINAPATVAMYTSPLWLWPVCVVLLYWVSRLWFLAHRGLMDMDPVLFAIRDRVSWALAVLIVVFALLAGIGS